MGIPQTWAFDAPTGVYKSHAMSMNLRKAAIADMKFMQFVSPEPGYGKGKGDTLTVTRISAITEPTSGQLVESQQIPEDTVALSTTSVTVAEWGRSVPYTSLSDDLSEFNISNVIQQQLRDQMALIMDKAAADSFKTCKVKAIPDAAASVTFDTDGTASTAATVNLNTYHLERIFDYMYETLKIPFWEGDNYVGVAINKALRGLKDDPSWEEWKKYTDPDSKFNGEFGRWENIRLVRTNNTSALSNTKGTGSVLGEAIIFGRDAVKMVEALSPELRTALPTDFGRSKSVAWYGILNFLLVWDTANAGEARVIHVTSS